jgi:peptide/nickel transport system substrate-binding protein
VTTYGSNHQVGVSWEIAEALARMVTEGGRSGTAWSFSSDPAFVEVDVLKPNCLADLRAKLEEMAAARHLPPQIARWKSADQAVQDYRAAIRFIDEHGNGYISNGPFAIHAVDTGSNFVELRAFRDERYPYSADFWPSRLATQTTRIDGVSVPSIAGRDRDAMVGVRVSLVGYPSGAARGADASVRVKATLVAAAGSEKVYTGTFVAAGEFAVRVPAADVGALGPGSHTLVIETSLGDELPATEVASLVVF